MRLPNIRYQSKPNQFSQVRFSGIDRSEYHGDGSIYDMMNISTHDFPLLTAIADRYESEDVHEFPWYYGKAEKEFIIKGKRTHETEYLLWDKNSKYIKGDHAADLGRIYIYTGEGTAENPANSTKAPHLSNDVWKIDGSIMFAYDEKFSGATKVKKGGVYYYNGKYYVNLTGECAKASNGNNYNPTVNQNKKNFEEYHFAKLYYNGREVPGFEVVASKKECAYLNGYIVILPDNVYYRTDDGTYGYLTGTKSGMFVTKNFTGYYDDNNSSIWRDSKLRAYILKESDYEGTTYKNSVIKLYWDSQFTKSGVIEEPNSSVFDLTEIFSPGDVVTVKQNPAYTGKNYVDIEDGTYEIVGVEYDQLIFKTNTFSGAKFGKESHISGQIYALGQDVTFSKGIPEMDYLCVSNNRMWGCKDDTVYGSELGNVFSWQRYGGEDIDPIFLESGDIGNFTGCCEYGGYPIFFKEREMYRVYGNVSSNFALTKVADYGLRSDSPKSISVVDSVLFFLSESGVCAYTGGIPAVISRGLKTTLSDAVSGTDGVRYYISAKDSDGRRIYVYDTDNRVWSSEERDAKPLYMVNVGEDLVAMDEQGKISTVSKPSGNWGKKTEVRHNAYIEFADFYDDYIGKKDVGKVIMRISVDPTKNPVFVYIQYDSDGQWHRIGKVFNQSNAKKVCEFGFFPRRCDHYRIRLECKGIFTLYSIARQTDLGTV